MTSHTTELLALPSSSSGLSKLLKNMQYSAKDNFAPS
jgi:hypothetical protein